MDAWFSKQEAKDESFYPHDQILLKSVRCMCLIERKTRGVIFNKPAGFTSIHLYIFSQTARRTQHLEVNIDFKEILVINQGFAVHNLFFFFQWIYKCILHLDQHITCVYRVTLNYKLNSVHDLRINIYTISQWNRNDWMQLLEGHKIQTGIQANSACQLYI